MNFTEHDWNQVLANLSLEMDKRTYETWIKPLNFQELEQDTIILEAPNEMSRKWIERLYLERIKRSSLEVTGCSYEIKIHPKKDEKENQKQSSSGRNISPVIPKGRQKLPTISLNPRYTFENYIVGKTNQYCYAMAKAVAEQPGTSYNPLFIHGAVGLGKTHLLQAICHELLKERDDLSILYLSSDNFIEQLIDAIQQGGLSKFRYKYRYVDVLLVDDIHYVANKEQTQEEFFHIFNNLYTAQKQIILSSDSPPKEIPSLQERLVSRFKWGVVANMEPPTYETRMAIVRKKAEVKNHVLAGDVVEFIAKNFTQNIRELEGAVWKLESYSSLIGETITVKLAKEVLKDLIQGSKTKISMGEILEEVTRVFQVILSDLQSKKRSQSIAVPRQICMYLARNFTDLSLEDIGEYFGGRDHSTVAHSIEKISKQEIEKNSKLMASINIIIDNLKGDKQDES